MVITAGFHLPGDFQTACSEIFGGTYQGIHGGNPPWETNLKGHVGMSLDLAKQTFRVGMSTHVTDEVAKAYMEQNDAGTTATKSYTTGLEVTQLIRASDEVQAFYRHHSAANGLKPLGRLVAKTWIPPSTLPRDLTEEERAIEADPTALVETHDFLIEDYVLDSCFVGMKLEVTVREMSFGLKFFDTVSAVYCSFYTLLPNELMLGWRIPEAEPLPYRESYNVRAAHAEDFAGEDEEIEENADLQQTEKDDANDNNEAEAEKQSGNIPSIEVAEA